MFVRWASEISCRVLYVLISYNTIKERKLKVIPVAPVSPLGPGRELPSLPLDPGGPIGPVGPVGPGCPLAPGLPGEPDEFKINQNFHCQIIKILNRILNYLIKQLN